MPGGLLGLKLALRRDAGNGRLQHGAALAGRSHRASWRQGHLRADNRSETFSRPTRMLVERDSIAATSGYRVHGAHMTYRYMMHWCADGGAPMEPGRRLLGQTDERALAEAAALWITKPRRSAISYVVVDTDDGSVLYPPDLEHNVPKNAGAPRRRFSANAIGVARVTAVMDRLQLVSEPEQRRRLLSRLIEEVDRFDEPARRLDVVNVYMEQASHKIHLLDLSAPEVSTNPIRLSARISDLKSWREVLDTLTSYRAALEERMRAQP